MLIRPFYDDNGLSQYIDLLCSSFVEALQDWQWIADSVRSSLILDIQRIERT
jgi:hypothetical protein